MKFRYFVLAALLVAIIFNVGCAVYQLPLKARLYDIPGWTDSVKEVQKKYPVIDKIEYRTPFGPLPSPIDVYTNKQVDVQAAKDMMSYLKNNFFTEKMLQGLSDYYCYLVDGNTPATISDWVPALEIRLKYKKQYIYTFYWDLHDGKWCFDDGDGSKPFTPSN